MSEWNPISSAPKDRPLLLYGELTYAGLNHPVGLVMAVGRWSEIDQEWTLDCMPATAGPFIDPLLWAEVPDEPRDQAEGAPFASELGPDPGLHRRGRERIAEPDDD